MILVSHDMHLLTLVADRLWLVNKGTVTPYEEDLQAYRKMLLTVEKPVGKPKTKTAVKKASREDVQVLKAEARKCEQRVEKLNDMSDKLAKKLADPKIYEDGKQGEMEVWQRKYAEVRNAQDRAEDMWMRALEKLEKAQT